MGRSRGGRGLIEPHAVVDGDTVVVDYGIEIRQRHVEFVSFWWEKVDVREWEALPVRGRHEAIEVSVAVFLSSLVIEHVDLNMVLWHCNVGQIHPAHLNQRHALAVNYAEHYAVSEHYHQLCVARVKHYKGTTMCQIVEGGVVEPVVQYNQGVRNRHFERCLFEKCLVLWWMGE